MELLVTLSEMSLLEKLTNTNIDGIIFGSVYSNKFKYSLTEMKQINVICKAHNFKRYVSIDSMILENDKSNLYYYLEFLKGLNLDGIYFADLGVIKAAQEFDLQDILIYDPVTLITNSLDASFWANRLNGAVVSRELTFVEIEKIVKKNTGKLDMQIAGHLRMSSSRRKFLSNYFNQLGKDVDVIERNDIRLVEESRDYSLPIRETKYGTEIFTDYCLLMYPELLKLRPYLKRGIIDSDFLTDDLTVEIAKDINDIDHDNVFDLMKNKKKMHPEVCFDTGYLYNKTVKKKEENE